MKPLKPIKSGDYQIEHLVILCHDSKRDVFLFSYFFEAEEGIAVDRKQVDYIDVGDPDQPVTEDIMRNLLDEFSLKHSNLLAKSKENKSML